MGNQYSFTTANSLSALAELCGNVHDILLEKDVAPDLVYAIDLSLEEMATNIIKYGYDDNYQHFIELSLQFHDDCITLTLLDDGHEFDPTKVADVDTSSSIDERAVGGMGIHLTRQMVDSMKYERKNKKNVLLLTKKTL